VLLQGLKVRQRDASTPGLKGIRSGNVSIFGMIIVDSEFRAVHCRGNRSDCLLSVVPGIVVGADVFKASGPIAVTCVTYALDFAQWK
jgi:hypothetical protein